MARINVFDFNVGRALTILQQIEVPEGMNVTNVETYHNGRESGLAAHFFVSVDYYKRLVWAENRNSDHIVLYVGDALSVGDFDITTGIPSDDVYDTRMTLDDEVAAVEFIQTLLKGWVKQSQGKVTTQLAT